ncbi:MAG: deoxyhypusine synthase family protein, partial [Promethearchaeota archaeon]
SWGKVATKGETVQVHMDCTIALPIILAFLLQKKKDGII